ncbi:MAG: hypothetical protein N2491_06185 [Negativicutes bacterium]|nr:hypothetical protein [Negativicutes bacterium]
MKPLSKLATLSAMLTLLLVFLSFFSPLSLAAAAGELTVTGVPSTIAVHERAYFTITGGDIPNRKPGYTPYTITVDNPNIIRWSYNSGDTYSLFAYAPGTVTLTVKDQGGNTKTFKVTAVTAPFALEAPTKIQYRTQDFFYVKMKRGQAPYAITISDQSVLKQSPSSNPNVTHDFLVQVLKPGVATITIRDGAGKQASVTVEVYDPTAGKPLTFASHLAGQTLKTNIGYALNPQGGTPPYSYSASSANLSISANGTMMTLVPGTYTVTVLDSAGRQASKQFTFVNNDALQGLKLTLSASQVMVGSTINLKIEGGTPPYSVTAPAANLSVAATAAAGDFVLKGVASSLGSPVLIHVKDNQGRGATTQVIVAPNPNQAPQAKLTANEIFIGEAATLTITGGTAPYIVTIDNQNAVKITKINDTTYRFDGLAAGLANITVRDARNLPAFTYLRVKEKPQPKAAKLEAVITDPTLYLTSSVAKVRFLTVWGGQEPYAVTASNQCIIVKYYGLSPSGAKQYQVGAQQRGTGAIKIVDASGQQVVINVTVK